MFDNIFLNLNTKTKQLCAQYLCNNARPVSCPTTNIEKPEGRSRAELKGLKSRTINM